MSQDISSIVIVPKSSTLRFGDLQQITCNPNEIFISSATVNDVEIIESVTASQLQRNQLPGSSSTSIFGGYTPSGLRNLT